jgi:hypothetical protein
MVINKDLFLKTVGKMDWSVPYGYCIKTSYCNLNKIEGNYHADFKLRRPYLNTDKLVVELWRHSWFSIDDTVINSTMLEALERIFSLKSKFEL